jgi:hypothetical protein
MDSGGTGRLKTRDQTNARTHLVPNPSMKEGRHLGIDEHPEATRFDDTDAHLGSLSILDIDTSPRVAGFVLLTFDFFAWCEELFATE